MFRTEGARRGPGTLLAALAAILARGLPSGGSAAESDAAAGEEAGVSGDFKVAAVFGTSGVVAAAPGGGGSAIAIEGDAEAVGAGHELFAVLQLHQFRVQLCERVAGGDREQIEALAAARAAGSTVLGRQRWLPAFAGVFVGLDHGS